MLLEAKLDLTIQREGKRITFRVSRSVTLKWLFTIIVSEDAEGGNTAVKVYCSSCDILRRQVIPHGYEASINGVLKRVTEIIEHFDNGNDDPTGL